MNVGATKKIKPDQLTGTLAESLLEWERENEERFFRAIDDAASGHSMMGRPMLMLLR